MALCRAGSVSASWYVLPSKVYCPSRIRFGHGARICPADAGEISSAPKPSRISRSPAE